MTELHTNGNYEAYLAQLFNPAAVSGQFNPGVFGPSGSGGIGTAYGGVGAGAFPNAAVPSQNPWAALNFSQPNALWQQQTLNPVQSAIQAAQQIAAKQVVHAIQCAQALQQIAQQLAVQQSAQQPMGWQQQFGQGQPQFGQGMSALQQQPIQQLAQYLASQQPGQFRYGLPN
jgi:hypothetical protein